MWHSVAKILLHTNCVYIDINIVKGIELYVSNVIFVL